jgi:hypothetical protein
MTRSVWTKNFIRTVAEYLEEGKTYLEISELLGVTPTAVQVGTSRYRWEISKAMYRRKQVVVEQPVVEEEIVLTGLYKTLELDFEVRLYAVDGHSDFPIHGAIRSPRGWESCSWTKTGHFSKDGKRHIYDLVKVPLEDKGTWCWVNWMDKHETFLTKHKAEEFKRSHPGRIFKLKDPV